MMRTIGGNMDLKHTNRMKILKYLLDNGSASRQELVQQLGISFPTVIQSVKDLMERGFVVEVGEYNSTGGRKAKILGVAKGLYFSVGAEITKHSLQLVLVDMNHDVVDSQRFRYPFEDTTAYYTGIGERVCAFLENNGISKEHGNTDRILGVGFSLPGLISKEGIIQRSLILNISSAISTTRITQYIPYDTVCAQNSDNATLAEAKRCKSKNVVSFFLNDTVGGGAFLDNKMYVGDGNKGALIGHMVLVPGGRRCYCGKRGCLNAYCSALALRRLPDMPLSEFFHELRTGNDEYARIWDEYLNYLAVAVANIRMTFECDVLLGGDVSEYVQEYRTAFEGMVLENCVFEDDTSFLRFGKYKQDVFAVGAAFLMIDKSIEASDLLV